MNFSCVIDLLAIVVAVIGVTVAIIAAMFGYNILDLRKKVYERLDEEISKLKKEIDSNKEEAELKIEKAKQESIGYCDADKCMDNFVEYEIAPNAMPRHKDGMNDLVTALGISARLGDPYISACLLNRLTKIVVATGKDGFKGRENTIYLYSENLDRYIDENINIITKSGYEDLMITNGKDMKKHLEPLLQSYI